MNGFHLFRFTRCAGDPSSLYSPLREKKNDLAILEANRQMRQEALPLAYRRTTFHFYDRDNLI